MFKGNIPNKFIIVQKKIYQAIFKQGIYKEYLKNLDNNILLKFIKFIWLECIRKPLFFFQKPRNHFLLAEFHFHHLTKITRKNFIQIFQRRFA